MKTSVNLLKIFVTIIIAVSFFPARSQEMFFNKLSPDDGSNFVFVTGITQDATGYMWFATKKGLYKYDGNKIFSYKNNPLDPKSIISNSLESICADSTGIIWIGSLGNGLDRFDPATGTFTHYQHDPDNRNSIINDTITDILHDSHGKLWIATHGGLDLFDPETNSFIHYRHDPDNPNSISNNQVRVLYEDSRNNLWIGAGSPYPDNGGTPESGGLTRFDPEKGTFTRFMHDPDNDNSISSNKIGAIYEDRAGTLWVGTCRNGLHRMRRGDENFERLLYDPEHPEQLSAPPVSEDTELWEHITFINEDVKGNLWYGTLQDGIYCYNPETGRMTNYLADDTVSGFNDPGAWTGFSSSDGIFWLGSILGSIYYVDPLRTSIPHHVIDGRPVSSFHEEPDGSLWIGTEKGIYQYAPNSDVPDFFLIDADQASKTNNNVYSISSDSQNNIWVGSANGLLLWNRQHKNFTRYKNDPDNPMSISDNDVFTLYEDRAGNFWVGTFNGLNLFDRKTGFSQRYYPANSNSNSRNIITSVLEDYTGKYWVGVWDGGGVFQFNPHTGSFKNVLAGTNILCLFEDSDQVFWAGGTEGLFRFDRNKNMFIRFGSYDQLINVPDVQGIIEDDQKNLWISTSAGIVRINAQRNETSTYGKNYGIDENSFIYLSCYMGRDGKIYFGNSTGYFAFMPGDITKNLNAPEIVFTGFHLADHLSDPQKRVPIAERLLNSNEIQLSHDQNVFVFDFLEIDYANPRQNKMFYNLENYDNNWHLANSERRAYYFNVPPGNYNFRVKAVNSYGIWAEKNIPVIIRSPWWQKWWAYVMYIFIFAAGVFAYDRLQRHRLLEREHRLAREKELAHAREIEKAYRNLELAHEDLKATQAQLIQSEKMASLGELTAGIAHEIQNPLNFVNNFSELNSELLSELKEEIRKGNMAELNAIADDLIRNEEKINLHGKRAESIVKGMLLHSRGSSGKKEPTDINALADECLRLAYHGFRAKDKSFNADFKLVAEKQLPKIMVIPQEIGRVLLNLINNAFYAVDKKAKQNSEGYKPMVVVSTARNKLPSGADALRIVIADNGTGIPESAKSKIFQPFFTTKPSGQGTGLGLSMSYDIIKALDGDILVISEENSGTEFIIEIPLKHKTSEKKLRYQTLDK